MIFFFFYIDGIIYHHCCVVGFIMLKLDSLDFERVRQHNSYLLGLNCPPINNVL